MVQVADEEILCVCVFAVAGIVWLLWGFTRELFLPLEFARFSQRVNDIKGLKGNHANVVLPVLRRSILTAW